MNKWHKKLKCLDGKCSEENISQHGKINEPKCFEGFWQDAPKAVETETEASSFYRRAETTTELVPAGVFQETGWWDSGKYLPGPTDRQNFATMKKWQKNDWYCVKVSPPGCNFPYLFILLNKNGNHIATLASQIYF